MNGILLCLIQKAGKRIQRSGDGLVVTKLRILGAVLCVKELIPELSHAVDGDTETNVDVVFIQVKTGGILIVQTGSLDFLTCITLRGHICQILSGNIQLL